MRGTKPAAGALCCLVAATITLGCGGDDNSSSADGQTVATAATQASTTASTQPSTTASTTRRANGPLDRFSSPPSIPEAQPNARVTRLVVRDPIDGDGARLREFDIAIVDLIAVNYTTGEVFATTWRSARTERITIDESLMPGLREGLKGMRRGGRRTILIPPGLGFAAIPSVAPELLDVPLYYVVDLRGIMRPVSMPTTAEPDVPLTPPESDAPLAPPE